MAKSKNIISHRGNLEGPHTARFGENHPKSINAALALGFDVEIDLWYEKENLYLGHDSPTYPIDKAFLCSSSRENFGEDGMLWIHCKTIETLNYMVQEFGEGLNFFYHNTDAAVLTSYGAIWTYPNSSNFLADESVAVLPELVPDWDLDPAFGVCTDYPLKYDKTYNL